MPYVANVVRTARALTHAEQKKVLKVSGEHAAGFRDHVILSMALTTALRESELAALNVGDVARGPNEIKSRIQLTTYARKGKMKGPLSDVRQRVFVPKMTRAKLRKFLAWKKRNGEAVGKDAPLFWAPRGGPDVAAGSRVSTRTIRHMWRTWQKRAGIDRLYTFHELRHTALTNLYAATKDVLLVQQQARHASVTTTQIYSHVSEEEIRRAVDDLPG